MFDSINVGFIGGGNMARAIAGGLINKGVLNPSRIYVSAPSDATVQSWKDSKVNATHNNDVVFNNCDIIFLAFKPHKLDQVIMHAHVKAQNKLFISILAGVSNEVIYHKVKNSIIRDARLIRSMPNIAVAVGEGCTAIAPHLSATGEDVQLTKSLYSALGVCVEVPEVQMEAVSAIIGSGPAYVFIVIEALADGAVKYGLHRDDAYTLAAQTLVGAGKTVLQSRKHPGQLKDEVCSPGGTTIHAVHELEIGNMRATFMNAVEAAVKRALEIAKIAKQ